MVFRYLFSIRFFFIIISLQMIFSGCSYTRTALKKIDPPAKISKFESICLSEQNELIFNFKVRLKEENYKEKIWSAKLDAEKAYKHSIVIDKPLPPICTRNHKYYKELEHSLKNMYAMSASNYSVSKLDCPCEFNKIPFREWSYGPISHELKSLDSKYREDIPRIKFVSPKSSFRVMDCGYLVFNTLKPTGNYKVTKIELPLPYKVYNKKKIALLPYYFVLDIITFPIQFGAGLILVIGGGM